MRFTLVDGAGYHRGLHGYQGHPPAEALQVKVMEIVSGTARNGAVAHCRLLTLEMLRAGHQVTVVSRPGSWILGQLPQDVETIVSTLRRNVAELRRMSRLVTEGHYDVIHTHMSSANYFGVLLKFLTGIPSVATAHHQRIQLHWRFNDQVIASSHDTVHYQRRFNGVPRRRLNAVRNFVDLERLRAVEADAGAEARGQLGISAAATVIGYVGDVVERKGLIYLVQALARVARACPHVVLLVVGGAVEGGGYHDRVRREAEQLAVAPRILWLGPRDDIPRLLPAMDIFALPSLQECMPLVILEAMAVGKPVVATSVGGVAEAVLHGETGFLVQPYSVEPLQVALQTLVEQEPLRTRMGAAGRARIDAEFNPRQLADRTMAILQRAAGQRHRLDGVR